ncbi:MAG: DUF3168 domain-containing protein [Rhizobiaceae bacterium]
MKAAAELQKAVLGLLGAHAPLVAMLGGPKILDHAPANVAFPYITFGRTSVFDWSTATEEGAEHLFTLHIWSKGKGKAEALGVMETVRGLLHDADIALASGQQLVNLRHEAAEVRYDDDLSVYHGTLRFRAVTEQAA